MRQVNALMSQLFWVEVVMLVCIRNDEGMKQQYEFGGSWGADIFETVVLAVLG